MNTGTVLSPRGARPTGSAGAGPAAGELRGKVVGLRRDTFWTCWDQVTDVWARRFAELGAEVRIWRAPVQKGEAAIAATAEFDEFVDAIDVAVVGLCNCGSCSIWAISDGLGALNHGLPTVAVATEHFVPLAKALAGNGGWPDMRTLDMPFPLEGRPEAEVVQIAEERFDALLHALDVTSVVAAGA
jgi:hypothetical protein